MKIENYQKEPSHRYVVVDYGKSEEVERFFYTKDEANAYVKENNGKVVGSFKKRLKIEETYYFKKWKKFNEIQ